MYNVHNVYSQNMGDLKWKPCYKKSRALASARVPPLVNMKLIISVTMPPRYECFEHRLTSRIHQSGKFAADDHIGRSGRMQILDNGLGDWDEAPGWYHGVGGSWVCLLPRTLSPDGKSFRQNGPILRFFATAIKSVLFMMLESKQNSCFILGKSLMGLGKPLIRHIKM